MYQHLVDVPTRIALLAMKSLDKHVATSATSFLLVANLQRKLERSQQAMW